MIEDVLVRTGKVLGVAIVLTTVVDAAGFAELLNHVLQVLHLVVSEP